MNILRKIKSGWMWFANKLGIINGTVLLTIVFVFFIGIYSCFIRFFSLFKKKPLRSTRWYPFRNNQRSYEELIREF